MSGTDSLPFGESKSPLVEEAGQELRLRRGALGIFDISATQSPTMMRLSARDSKFVRGALTDAPRRDTTMTQLL